MTTPINPGDLVSVPDPSTGGAGAPVIVSQVMNGKWRNAVLLLNAASARADDAIEITDPAPQVPLVDLDTSFVMPIKPVLPDNNPADAKAIFDDARAEIHDEITMGYVEYLQTYFPDRSYFDNAIAWINRALTTGGTGVNAAVEAQIYERGRARLNTEAMRAENDAMQAFANRGFPLPPGALAHQVQLIRQDLRGKLRRRGRGHLPQERHTVRVGALRGAAWRGSVHGRRAVQLGRQHRRTDHRGLQLGRHRGQHAKR